MTHLSGNQGDDALISEGAGNSGADGLYGGSGEDQTVVDNACGGHTLDGQSGSGDIAGFARSGGGYGGITARIGTIAYVNSIMFGPNPETCHASSVSAGNEVLEGTNSQGTWLYGDGNANTLWGRDGNDNLYGDAGNDEILGHGGADNINGENGNDEISGGDGSDTLYGNQGDDHLYGDEGEDTIWGYEGLDWLYGGAARTASARETVQPITKSTAAADRSRC